MEIAKYIGRSVDRHTVRGVHPVHLTYQYRGFHYTVTDMKTGINDLGEQPYYEQRRIDRILGDPHRNTEASHAVWEYEASSDKAFDRLMDFFETGEWNDG